MWNPVAAWASTSSPASLARALGAGDDGHLPILGAIAGISGGVIDLGLPAPACGTSAIDWQTDKTLASGSAANLFWLRVILAAVYIAGGILLAKPITQLVWPVPDATLLLSLALLSMGTTVLSGSINALPEATRYFSVLPSPLFSARQFRSVSYRFGCHRANHADLQRSLAPVFLDRWPGFGWQQDCGRCCRETAVSRPIRFPGIQTMRTLGQPLLEIWRWLWLGNILACFSAIWTCFWSTIGWQPIPPHLCAGAQSLQQSN
ncbi:MAG: hypothetical protein R3E31_25685 [Chloroflexota bacterium]